jgi:hypothetical protein
VPVPTGQKTAGPCFTAAAAPVPSPTKDARTPAASPVPSR